MQNSAGPFQMQDTESNQGLHSLVTEISIQGEISPETPKTKKGLI